MCASAQTGKPYQSTFAPSPSYRDDIPCNRARKLSLLIFIKYKKPSCLTPRAMWRASTIIPPFDGGFDPFLTAKLFSSSR